MAQPLAEFIAAVSAARTEAGAARAVVEHAAEALDADMAAIVSGGKLIAAVGYSEGSEPVAELEGVRPGAGNAWLEVPGVGSCAAAAATLEHPRGATLVLARQGPAGFSREDTGLLRGVAQVAATTMRVLSVLDDERAARDELRQLAREQAALRRVATLVATAATPDEVFRLVAAEVGHVVPAAEFAMVGRYERDRAVEVVGAWSRTGKRRLVGIRTPLGGRNVSTQVFERNQAARADHYANDASILTDAARAVGMRSSVGAPISVEGRLWGVMIIGSTHEDTLPPDAEHRLADFTELVATTIANAQAREELTELAGEQAALRRVATLVARPEPPDTVFAAVAEETALLLPADLTLIGRYGRGGALTGVASWSRTDGLAPVLVQAGPGGRNVSALVFETGRPARMDSYLGASGDAADDARARGIRAAVGAPIAVEGRLWGVIVAGVTRDEPLPPDTEERLAGFTELVATAIANAQARVELHGYANEQAALRRVATLVARSAPPEEVFAAVTAEIGRVLDVDDTVMSRQGPDGMATVISSWARTKDSLPVSVGRRFSLGGRNATGLVFQTGQPARIDGYGEASGDAAADARARGIGSAVAVPISIESRLWGVVTVASSRAEPLPTGTEERLAAFTELVATALANAQARSELTASRARIVATADETRRRIERDLHDGAQQQIVSLALQLRTMQAAVPPELSQLKDDMEHVTAGLTRALDELREYARGIHPAILTERGLASALKALARRCPIPVELDLRADARPPEHIEVTAYYVVSETLTNAAKHANASVVTVSVETSDGVLRVCVDDDGVGGADPARGSGIVGLKDRVEATGGTMTVRSPPGGGTCLVVDLPIAPPLQRSK